MTKGVVFDLSPTQSEFVHSDAEICILRGPMGEGKTYAAVVACMRHAVRCGMPISGALIRDTHQNIKVATVPSIIEVLGDRVTFHDDAKKAIFHTTPRVELDLFGIDDPASLSKLQAPQYAIIWLEEPAPIIEKANAGLPRDVFDQAIPRAARQRGTKMRVQISQNPADEDHWTEDLANEPEIFAEEEETGLKIIKKVFSIKYGENKYLNLKARLATKAGFKHDEGKTARYVLGVAAPVMQGVKVTPAYKRERHYAERVLPVIEGAIGVRGWDAWHNPAFVIGQLIPPGKLWVHDVLVAEDIGIKELIEEKVIPLLNTPKYKDKIHDWRDIGDPTMRTPDQSTVHKTTARVLEQLLKTRFEPGPTRWKARIDPLRTALLASATDGEPKILISNSAYFLHRTLNGGWHWKKDNNGRRVGSLPVNDNYCDVGNAFAYMVSQIFPYKMFDKQLKPVNRNVQMRMAMSYRGGNYGKR